MRRPSLPGRCTTHRTAPVYSPICIVRRGFIAGVFCFLVVDEDIVCDESLDYGGLYSDDSAPGYLNQHRLSGEGKDSLWVDLPIFFHFIFLSVSYEASLTRNLA